MKKIILLLILSNIGIILYSQISKTINIVRAGTLSSALTANEFGSVTNLTITGTIDARDFETMRDYMPSLSILDISGVTIAAYTGTRGTNYNSDSYAVNTIPQFAFSSNLTYQGKTSLKSISLPTSVTDIGTSAFYNCNRLSSVNIPSSVTSIEDRAFGGCSNLTSIVIPSSINHIGGSAFFFSGLTSISIPPSVISIEDGVFRNCVSLTSVTIASSVISIGNSAFENCSGLTSITIPSSVTSIGDAAFYGCIGLTSIAFPSSVISIGASAFFGCSSLMTISIPSSVTSIGDAAFRNCSGTIIVDAGNTNYSSLDGILFDKTKTTLIQCPTSKTGNYTFPSSVTSVGVCAFISCNRITSITISHSITTIANYAFSSCSGNLIVDESNLLDFIPISDITGTLNTIFK